VVVSRSGGLPEVLGDTGAGAVFDPGDITALALVLESFLSDEKLRDAATVASLPRAESFSIETAASGYADLFMSLMDRSDS
jgi:glycosyltransferase involved in cell wall biosynthesis